MIDKRFRQLPCEVNMGTVYVWVALAVSARVAALCAPGSALYHLREPSGVTTVAAPAMARAGPERAQVPFRARPSPTDPTRAPSYHPEGRPLRPARAPVTFPHATSHLHPRAPAIAPHTARTPPPSRLPAPYPSMAGVGFRPQGGTCHPESLWTSTSSSHPGAPVPTVLNRAHADRARAHSPLSPSLARSQAWASA